MRTSGIIESYLFISQLHRFLAGMPFYGSDLHKVDLVVAFCAQRIARQRGRVPRRARAGAGAAAKGGGTTRLNNMQLSFEVTERAAASCRTLV